MATSIEKAGLPPMVSHDEVVTAQQQTDLKEFRKYLIQSGAVKSLVKLYQHTLKNEIRMDNPNLVSHFMNKYRDGDDPRVEETEQLVAENSQLRETNVALAKQFAELEEEVEAEKKKKDCKVLWSALTSSQFWNTKEGMDEEKAAALKTEGLTGAQLFMRLCGAGEMQGDEDGGPGLSGDAIKAIEPESFINWLAFEAPPEAVAWCDGLVPKLKASADPPFAASDAGLKMFLESVLERFADSPAE